jgi:hypothetical protein
VVGLLSISLSFCPSRFTSINCMAVKRRTNIVVRFALRLRSSITYPISTQIRYHHPEMRYCSYAVMVNNVTRFQCLNGRDPSTTSTVSDGTSSQQTWRYTTCHMTAVTWLEVDDRVWLRDALEAMAEVSGHYVDVVAKNYAAGSFWGLVLLS